MTLEMMEAATYALALLLIGVVSLFVPAHHRPKPTEDPRPDPTRARVVK